MFHVVEQTYGGSTLFVYVLSAGPYRVGPLALATKTFTGKTPRGKELARRRAREYADRLNGK